ncbi:MAG: MFS transporter [Calothrix sp. MO_167.B42]|nr:MFS transporter [Calothrix sp. MO_167.B42]
MARSRIKAIALMGMCFALFMTVTDDTVLNVALPQIQVSLGSNVSGLQWILNAYTLPAASLVLTSGTLGDIYGRKRVFLIGVLIFIIASTTCGFAPNLPILIAGRIIQGIGAAALVPNSLAIVNDTFPEPKEKTQAIAIWSAVSGIALISGPVIGGILVDVFGWQSTFFMNVPFGLMAWVITSSYVKEVRNVRQQTIDIPGLLLSIVFLGSLTYALIEANAGVWRSPLILLLLTVVGLSFWGFLLVESHSSHPMLPLKLFKNTTFAVVNLVQVLVLFTFFSLLFLFSLFLQQVQGYSAVAAGMRFLPLNMSFVIGLLVSGWFSTRFGWRLTIMLGLIIAGVTTLLFIGISADTEYGTILWKLVLAGFGGGLTLTPIAAAAMSSAPPTQGGIASAILNASNRLGGILGIALQGTILTHWLTSHLRHSLSEWNVPSGFQEKIITQALRNLAEIPRDIPSTISTVALQQEIRNAFVSGLHTTLVIAGLLLLTGVALIFILVPSKLKERSQNGKVY